MMIEQGMFLVSGSEFDPEYYDAIKEVSKTIAEQAEKVFTSDYMKPPFFMGFFVLWGSYYLWTEWTETGKIFQKTIS